MIKLANRGGYGNRVLVKDVFHLFDSEVYVVVKGKQWLVTVDNVNGVIGNKKVDQIIVGDEVIFLEVK